VTCSRAQEFLAQEKLKTLEEVNAKKTKFPKRDALKLVATVDHLYAAKGKKVVYLNIKKDKPDQATLVKVMLGPTGNLRAPTLRVGKTLLIGFNAEIYQQVLKPK
jgi:arsenate reductase-like glutaredoxin family protein